MSFYDKKNEGDMIQLKNQEVEVVKCQKCDALMVNLDADQLAPGDLVTLKKAGVRISNPETEDPICIGCEFTESFGQRLKRWFETEPDEDDDNDDDSGFFTPGGIFGGSPRSGGSGFGGGFGGFGGGGFSGGGASRGF